MTEVLSVSWPSVSDLGGCKHQKQKDKFLPMIFLNRPFFLVEHMLSFYNILYCLL